MLQVLVVSLGGTEPIYRRDNTRDAMFQMCVSFTLPLDNGGLNYRTMRSTGNKCFSLCEAESEAAAAALQRFEGGAFNTKVIDISKLFCMEMKEKCQRLLVKAGNQQRVVDMLLSDWCNGTRHIDHTFKSLVCKITEDLCHAADDTVIQIRLNTADQVAAISPKSHQRHEMLSGESKDLKKKQWKTRAELMNIFKETLVPRVERHEGDVQSEIKISMPIVLSEMMISLGWTKPLFNTMWRAENQEYVCEVELQPKGTTVSPTPGNITVEGAGEASEEEARQSAATRAILCLEKQLDICLIDINYNRRSHVEAFLSEIEKLLNLASSLVKNVLAEWEGVVEEVRACEEYWRSTVSEHEAKDCCDAAYYIKWECGESIAKLHEACLFELQFGQHQVMSMNP